MGILDKFKKTKEAEAEESAAADFDAIVDVQADSEEAESDAAPRDLAYWKDAIIKRLRGASPDKVVMVSSERQLEQVPAKATVMLCGDLVPASMRRATMNEAFIEQNSEEERLVRAMRCGADMRVSAVSQRGTNTNYIISLRGITAALERVAAECR